MLTRQEAAVHLNISEQTVARWAKYGLIARHAYNGHYSLYEIPDGDLPQKQCSRWNQLKIGLLRANKRKLSQEHQLARKEV
ncbi:hypothetical protein ACOJBM_41025 [Rhizobium beringeri]